MTDEIVDAYENWVVKKWNEYFPLPIKGSQSESSNGPNVTARLGLLRSVFILLHELENQLLGTSENYVNVIIKSGKFHAAFAHVRKSNDSEISVTRLDLHEFQDKEVSSTVPDHVLAYFFEIFEKMYKLKPNCLRTIDAELLQSYVDFLSKYSETTNKYIPLNELTSLIVRWITAITTGKWTQYPDPPLCAFLRKTSTQYANLPIKLIPFILKKANIKQPTLFLLGTSLGIIASKLVPTPEGSEIMPVAENIVPPLTWEVFPEFLRSERVKHNAHSVIHIRLQPIMDLIKEIVITPPPLSQERCNVILQRTLHLFKDYGESWVTSPPPLTTNNLFRFLTRALGFNLNPQKLSYWFIPHAFTNLLIETTGGSGAILCLYRPGASVQGFVITVENATITKIESINADFLASIRDQVLDSNHVPENIKKIFYMACQTYPKVTNVLIVSEKFFDVLFGTLPTSFLAMRPLKIFSASGALKQLTDTRNFYMYPETVALQYLRKISGFKLLGWISRLFFDRHEF